MQNQFLMALSALAENPTNSGRRLIEALRKDRTGELRQPFRES